MTAQKENVVIEETASRVLYAVFEKETEIFKGVGDFSDEEVARLSEKFIFSKI